jgi:hypothetical protein
LIVANPNDSKMMQAPPAFYNIQLFVHPESVANYKCPLCSNVQKDPLQCKQGHGHCKLCIEAKTTCPTCFETLDILVPNRDAGRTIAESLVYCYTRLPYLLAQEVDGADDAEENEESASSSSSVARRTRNQGSTASAKRARVDHCTWTGKLQDAAAHFRECDYSGVVCSFDGCGAVVTLKDLNAHESGCGHRALPCKWFGCGEVLKGAELDRHQAECPFRLVVCPNAGCGSRVAASYLLTHRAYCTCEVVPCPFAAHGCTARVLRKDVDSHEDTAMKQHLRLVMKKVTEQQLLIESLQDQVMPVEEVIVLQVKHDELTGKVPFEPQNPAAPTTLYSEGRHMRGYMAHIFVLTKSDKPENQDHYGLYLSVRGGPFPRKVSATSELLHHDGNPQSAVKYTRENTYARAESWGNPKFISKALLTSPDNNPYVKDGYVTFKCTFKFV